MQWLDGHVRPDGTRSAAGGRVVAYRVGYFIVWVGIQCCGSRNNTTPRAVGADARLARGRSNKIELDNIFFTALLNHLASRAFGWELILE